MPFYICMLPWVICFFAGASLYSFLNVVVWRIPRGRSFVTGRSACPACGHTLGPLELVPVLSWLFLGAHCRYCGAPVSPRYVLMELLGGGAAVTSIAVCGLSFWALILFTAFSTVVLIWMLRREKRRVILNKGRRGKDDV